MEPVAARSGWSADETATRTVVRQSGRVGELVLRERGGHYEVISNGMFLMDTRDGRSERQLVRWALDTAPRPRDQRVMIAGLGVGFSLAEALTSPDVTDVLVIEWEPAVVAWNRTTTGACTGGSVDDPQVRCEIVDVVEWLRRPVTETFHAVCLDVDNGPGWTVSPANRWLYRSEGLAAVRERLVDGGVLTVWAAGRAPSFERRLQRHFREVDRVELPVPRGPADVIYRARC